MNRNSNAGKQDAQFASFTEADKTLRLIAQLPAPLGIEGRVKDRLRGTSHGGQVVAWPLEAGRTRWLSHPWVRGATAAAIVALVGAGAFSLYSRIEIPPQPAAQAVPLGPRAASPGSFSNANAVRTPQTLQGPVLVHPAQARKGVAAQPAASSSLESKTGGDAKPR